MRGGGELGGELGPTIKTGVAPERRVRVGSEAAILTFSVLCQSMFHS